MGLRVMPLLQGLMLLGVAFLAGRVVWRTWPLVRRWRSARATPERLPPPLLTMTALGVAVLCLAGTICAGAWVLLAAARR
ncbi:MAG TPA: hypothetical protein VG389_26295 [Myxococcota bacterium]|jgi:hypothetical protein|nr:hypothetical protein [Myxococcota bacterium]